MKPHSRLWKKSLFVCIGLVLAACGAGQTAAPTNLPVVEPSLTLIQAPTATPEPVAPAFAAPTEGPTLFKLASGQSFPGKVYGQGETAIIVASGVHGGERIWGPFVNAVDKQTFTAVTYSYLQQDPAGAVDETAAILEFLRQAGYQRVICVGVSLGVTSCGSITTAPEMIGMVLVAGPEDSLGQHGGDCLCDALSSMSYPKLFVAGEKDSFAVEVQELYDQASEPKTIILYSGNKSVGAHLFDSPDREAYLQLLLDFVNRVAQNEG